MSSRKAYRIAPSRDGHRVASAWRFWRSGDEFYAAVRNAAHLTKVSFHRNGNWQLRMGAATKRLMATRHYLPGWLHVVSIQWFLYPGSLRPLTSGSEDVELVEVPEDHKLAVNIILSTTKAGSDPPLPREGGRFVWREHLRDSRLVVVHAVTLPLAEQDHEARARILREAPPLTYETKPDPADVYAEISIYTTRPESGNVIGIAPLPPDRLRGRIQP
jgi:hypothetical protein